MSKNRYYPCPVDKGLGRASAKPFLKRGSGVFAESLYDRGEELGLAHLDHLGPGHLVALEPEV